MRHLITSALPYANGPIHFGHIAGVYLPADIYTKHKKLSGQKAIHISGSDEHGVAIMQNAKKAKKEYKPYVDKWHKEHKDLFDLYNIHFDFFGQTSTEYHKEEVIEWFKVLHEKEYIEKRANDQLQCQDCHNYLPDRFVEGTCYECGYEEARGDECPNCGTWIDAVKLKDPVCKFCNSKNIEVKSVDQWYLVLSKFHKEFRDWFKTNEGQWKKSVYAFVDSLSKENMVDRAITRDLDWGIDVPLTEAVGKKLYVWFDAPIGYVSNTKELFKDSDEDYLKDWWQNDEAVITNFIGKDNIIFHSIIFPMMCLASGKANAVKSLPANQYVNLEGKQFSKSKGHYVDAFKAIHEFGSDNLRYYLTTLIPESNDSSFTWAGFEAKINNELANNIGNFINRSLTFFFKNWKETGISKDKFLTFFDTDLAKDMKEHIKSYYSLMEEVQIKRSLESLMALGQKANTFFSDGEPWALIKTDMDACSEVIAHSSIYALVLGILFEPFLPNLASKIQAYFPDMDESIKRQIYQGNIDALKDYYQDSVNLVKKPKGLVKKVDNDRIVELSNELK
ncbi:MAG: methionine--tRNA ligase [Bacteriovoracaceae bacterium]|jgi:methionyl-tRNA synthetase|nr:methionine--tRNA ligase [Bacteriovoracaceae bacterium]